MNDDRLDQVLRRLSSTLEELSYACSDVQSVSEMGLATDSNEAVIKAQALDRITQTLLCLSEFSAAMSDIPETRDVAVGPTELNSISLPSVRGAISGEVVSAQLEENEISLF